MISRQDPLAYASQTPDIGALFDECTQAQHAQMCNLGRIQVFEAERYQWRDGKDGSGQLWARNLNDRTKLVKPYDGCPDPDASLTDEICENEVDLDLIARAMGSLSATTSGTSELTASQMGELLAVARYVLRAIDGDLADDEELLAQMKANLGTAVLNPGWRERWELVEREIDLEGFIGMVIEATQDVEGARQLYAAILDPTLEALAISSVAEMYPHLPAQRVKRIVRDLREKGAAEFLDKQLAEKRPTIRALIPGYNYFVMGSAGNIDKARGHVVIERVSQAELEALAADNDWNKGFVERAIGTAGLYSTLGEGMQQKTRSEDVSSEDKTIELWTTYVLQFDKELNSAGIYCTTFSPHATPGQGVETDESYYAHHYLLDYAHRNAPFILARREVTGPAMFDSRGVPEITLSNSNVIRNLQKAGLARAHLEVNPPRAFIGFGGTKLTDWNTPGAKIESLMPNAEVKDLGPSKGNPQVGEMAIERVERATHRLFAFPDAEVHPARWQPRAMRKSARTLRVWQQAITQLVVLCYQNFEDYELAQIIGKFPQLKLEDVLQHRVQLRFDPRGLDNDWRKQTLETIMQLLTIDKGGLVDTGPAIRIIGSYTDPTLMDSIIRDPAGAQEALYRQVEGEMMSLMDGNPPKQVQDDATAGMQLKMAMQIIGQNPKYQQILMQNAEVKENFKVWVQNRQHNVQETQLSPMQGRLGTAQAPQTPVRQGPPP